MFVRVLSLCRNHAQNRFKLVSKFIMYFGASSVSAINPVVLGHMAKGAVATGIRICVAFSRSYFGTNLARKWHADQAFRFHFRDVPRHFSGQLRYRNYPEICHGIYRICTKKNEHGFGTKMARDSIKNSCFFKKISKNHFALKNGDFFGF